MTCPCCLGERAHTLTDIWRLGQRLPCPHPGCARVIVFTCPGDEGCPRAGMCVSSHRSLDMDSFEHTLSLRGWHPRDAVLDAQRSEEEAPISCFRELDADGRDTPPREVTSSPLSSER